jgi:hypothetical protein
MSIAGNRRRGYWAHVGRMVKGFGRAFAVKKLSTMVDPAIARAIVKRYISNQRVRA